MAHTCVQVTCIRLLLGKYIAEESVNLRGISILVT